MNKTVWLTMRPSVTFSIFLFLFNFLIDKALSSSSLLFPRCLFFLIAPSSLLLLLPHPFYLFILLPRRSFLLVTHSSSSLFPPRCSFLLVTPSSLSLFLPRPALSKSLRIHKRPFFIDFDESVTDRPTDGPTDRPTDRQRDF